MNIFIDPKLIDKNKPIAQGKDLVEYIESNLYPQLTLQQRLDLRTRVNGLVDDLKAPYNNPMSQSEYLAIKALVQANTNLSDLEKQAIDTISNQWAQGVKFE